MAIALGALAAVVRRVFYTQHGEKPDCFTLPAIDDLLVESRSIVFENDLNLRCLDCIEL
jgi:hypothetical protein